MSGKELVLEARNLFKSFGNVRAVQDVSLKLYSGEILSIVGPNGAGKTTLLNLLSGVLPPDSGEIILYSGEGRMEITGKPSHEISRLGIGRSFQIPNIFEGLTVGDNLRASLMTREGMLGVFTRRYTSYGDVEKTVIEVSEIFGLGDRLEVRASELSHGERKKLDIALSIIQNPRILLMDEPTSGLTHGEKRDMARLITRLRDEFHTSFIVVEHDLDVVHEISDSLIVMHEGRVLAYDVPKKVMRMSEVIQAYLGGEVK